MAGQAQAGSYRVDECTSQAIGAPDARYEVSWNPAYNLFRPAVNCTVYGMSLGPSQAWGSPVWGRWTLTAPEGTTIIGGAVNSFISDTQNPAPSPVRGSGWDGYTAEYLEGGGRHVLLDHLDTPGRAEQSLLWPNPARSVVAVMNCGGASGCGPPQNQVLTELFDVHLTLADSEAPRVSGFGGELATGGAHSGTESLTVGASDVGSGVSDVIVRVNGSEIGRPGVSGCNATSATAYQFTPCPTAATVALPAVNTAASPWQSGSNVVEACPRDYANGGSGPNVGACAQLNVVVDNSCPASTGPNVATRLDAALQSGSSPPRPSIAVKSTDAATVSGGLSGPSGPVAGATVCVYERLDLPGQSRALVSSTNTHRDGSFQAQIAPGPSRVFDVAYRYNNRQVESGHLHLDSTAVPSLKLRPKSLRNGDTVHFFGAIPGPFADARAVTLQAQVGRSWRTFEQLRSSSDGSFKGRYRFKYSTLPTIRYTFRVQVKQQNGYPYEAGQSRHRKVIVHG